MMTEKTNKSFVINGYIVGRDREELVIRGESDGHVSLRLDRYAIVPLEKYEENLNNVRQILADQATHPEKLAKP